MNAWDDGREQPYLDPAKAKPRFTLEEITEANFIPTSGVIWRWDGLQVLPEAFSTATFGDWALNVRFATKGPIGHVDRMMGVRRVHEGGIMSVMGELRTKRGIALAYEVMHRQVGDWLAPAAVDRWAKQLTDGFDRAMHASDREHAAWFLSHAGRVPHGRISLRIRERWWMQVHFPGLMHAYARLRKA